MMAKRELINFFKMYAQLWQEEKKLMNERDELAWRRERELRPPIEETRRTIFSSLVRYIIFTVAFAIGSFILGLFIVLVGLAMNPSDGWASNFLDWTSKLIPNYHPAVSFVIFFFIISAILMLPIIMFMHIYHNKNYKRENMRKKRDYAQRCKQFEPINKRLQYIKLRLKSIESKRVEMAQMIGLSESSPALMWASDTAYYLETGRANTVKEAIRLIDADMEREAQEHREVEFQKQMLEQSKAQINTLNAVSEDVERAADAAEDAAFWEKASTFITADALDKIRKDLNK